MSEATIREAGQLRQQAHEEFVLLARRVALGEEVEPAEIASVCRDAGKETDQFASLVRSLRHRAQLRVQAAAREQIEKEIAENERLRNESWLKVEEESRRHERLAGPLQDRWVVLTRELGQIQCVPGDLSNSCPCPRLAAEKRRLELEGRQLSEQHRDAAGEVERLQAQLRQLDPKSEDAQRFGRAVERAKTAAAEVGKRVAENARRADENYKARIDF
jgi:hypothetical protein